MLKKLPNYHIYYRFVIKYPDYYKSANFIRKYSDQYINIAIDY